MNWRVLHSQLLFLKLADRRPSGEWAHAAELFATELAPVIARRKGRFPGSEELAAKVSALCLGQVRSCTIWYLSGRLLDYRTVDVARSVAWASKVGLDQRSLHCATPSPVDRAHAAAMIEDLLVLSRRPWALLCVSDAADRGRGRLGRLAASSLGAATRQSILTEHVSGLRRLRAELAGLVRGDSAESGPWVGLLEDVHSAVVASAGAAYAPVLDLLGCPALREAGPGALRAALGDLVATAAGHRDLLLAAAADWRDAAPLWRDPGDALPPGEPLPRLAAWLCVLPSRHRGERDPGEALHALAAIRRARSVAPRPDGDAMDTEEPTDRATWRRALADQLVESTPQWVVFHRLLLGDGVAIARQDLLGLLPAPRELARLGDDLDRTQGIVAEWVRWAHASERGVETPDDIALAWEIPEGFHHSDRLLAVQATFAAWAEHPAAAPPSWQHDEETRQLEPALRFAWFAVIVEELHELAIRSRPKGAPRIT